MSKKPDDRRYGVWWICPNCEGNPEFEQKAMMEHMREVHKVDTSGKGNRSMLMHMDGDKWFSWSYEWTLGDLKFIQHTCQKRGKSDFFG